MTIFDRENKLLLLLVCHNFVENLWKYGNTYLNMSMVYETTKVNINATEHTPLFI